MDRKTVQTPIYYVSRTLTDDETSIPDLSGWLAKWSIELGEHTIEYKSRPTIKGQILADFVTEVLQHKETECLNEQQIPTPPEQDQVWSLFTDGASSGEGSGAGLRLIAKKLGVQHLETRADSMLIAGLINGSYEAKNEVIHIKRSEKKSADALSKLASTNFEHFAKDIRIEFLDRPSVPQHQVLVIQTGFESWMTPIVAYLSSGALPEGKSAAQEIRHKALNYQLQDGVLYHRSFLSPLLICVDAEEANY
ncbi:uncharacterized protein LOC143626683 [Bidens hawaiensis]|uniref:uncharacterized protein LOC143626683 n=1 Tax=Bidens hawaiensis TaxID=980011 RepID=UPI00404ABB68